MTDFSSSSIASNAIHATSTGAHRVVIALVRLLAHLRRYPFSFVPSDAGAFILFKQVSHVNVIIALISLSVFCINTMLSTIRLLLGHREM